MRSTKSCFNGMALTIFLMLKNLNIQILEKFRPSNKRKSFRSYRSTIFGEDAFLVSKSEPSLIY